MFPQALARKPVRTRHKVGRVALAAAVLIASTLGLSVATLATSSPQAAADPFSSPQSYSTQADSHITRLVGTLAGIGPDLTVTRTVSTASSVGQSAANVRILQGAVTGTGLTVPITSANQVAPPDHTTPSTGGLSSFGPPSVLTLSALSGNALARGFATACPPSTATPQNDPDPDFQNFVDNFVLEPGDPELFPADSRMLSRGIGKMGGLTMGGVTSPLGGLTIFDVKALSTVDASLMVPTGTPDSYGVRAISTAEVAGIDLLKVPLVYPNGAVRFSWGGFNPYVSAEATGVPGGAKTEMALPAVQVQGPTGAPFTLNPGSPPVTIGIPSIGSVTISVGAPTTNVASADGTHAEITVPLLSIDVNLLLGLGQVHYDILPMHAVADMESGVEPGIQCATTIGSMTPDQGPTAGGTTVTITGENFAQGQTTVTIDGVTVPATVSDDGKSLTFVTPPHPEGSVDVVVNTPEGSVTVPEQYTYIPPAPVIAGPVDGSFTTDTTPPVTGTGYPGSTIDVTDEDGNPVCSATVAADGTWTCTPVTPMEPGEHTLTATQTTPGGDVQESVPIDFTIVAPPVITSPTDGGSTADKTPEITGTGHPGSTITVDEGGTTLCTATVAADGTWSCTPTTNLTPGDHTITAIQDGPDGTQTSEEVTFTVLDASLTLAKSGGLVNDLDGNGTDVDDTITYTFTVENTGAVAVDNVTVTDPKISPTAISCGTSPLAPGATSTCTADYLLTQADIDGGSIDNTATVNGTVDGSPVSAEGSTTTPVDGAVGTLTVVKTGTLVDGDSDGVADAGETIDYTITATNAGTITLTNVQVVDTLLASMTCTPAIGSDLAPGEDMVCTGSHLVNQPEVDSGSVINTATATGTNPADPSGPVEGGNSFTVDADKVSSLTTVKEGSLVDGDDDGFADVGEIIDYAITVTNTGALTVSNVQVSDPMLAAMTCTPSLGSNLAPDEELTCTGSYTVSQVDVDAGVVHNVATVTGENPDGSAPTSPGDSHDIDTDDEGILTVAKTGTLVDSDDDGVADAGETVNYSITVTNDGAFTVNDVQVSDPKIPTLACTPSLGAALAPGDSMICTGSYSVQQADVDGGAVNNTATATGSNPADPQTPVTGGGSSTVETDQAGELTTVKSAMLNDLDNDGFADLDEIIDYSITITNTGAVTLSDLTVSDPLLPALSCQPTLDVDLAPDAEVVCTGSYAVTQADVDSGVVHNEVTVTGQKPDGTPATSPGDSHDVDTDIAGELTVVKTAALTDGDGDGFADAFETIDYTITVTNSGSVTVNNVAVTDPKIATLACLPALGGDLAPGEEIVCTGTYEISQADVDSGSVDNTATATGDNPADPNNPVEGGGGSVVEADPSGELTTDKVGTLVDDNGNGLADLGETITYAITVVNTSDVTIADVGVDDPKIADLVCSPATGSELGPNEAMTCIGSYTVAQTDVDAGVVHNSVTVTGENPDGTPSTSPGDSHDVDTESTGILDVSKVGALVDADVDGVADAGETINYTITVTNNGTVTVNDVAVADAKLPSLSCLPATGADLAPGATMECSGGYTVTQDDVNLGSVDNTATASGINPADPGTPVTGGGTFSVEADGEAELTTVKNGVLDDTDDDQVADVGETIDYTITVTNTGAVTISGVQVDDPKISTLDCLPALGSALEPSESITCTGGYLVTQEDIDSGSVINSVSATGTTPTNGTPTSPGDTHEIEADQAAELTTDKTGDLNDTDEDGFADVGEVIDYTITVTNTGSVTVSNAQVLDPRITELNCTPALGGSLAAKESLICTGSYPVTQADVDSGSVINSVTVTGTTPGGSAPTSPGDTNEIPADQAAELTTVKTGLLNDLDNDQAADLGETIDYTITVTNSGSVTIAGVQVSDPKIASLSCNPAQGASLASGAVMTCTGTYPVAQADIDSGSVLNSVTVTGTTPTGEVPTSPGDEHELPADISGELTTVKLASLNDGDDDGFADAGETIDYTITVTNTGSVTVTDVQVSDPQLATMTCSPVVGSDLAPDEVLTCTGTSTVTQADVDAGSINNVATVTGTNPADPGTPVESGGGSSVLADEVGELTTTKTGSLVDGDNDGRADLGETINYSITVTNTSDVTISDVAVSDPKLPDLSCTPGIGSALAPDEAMTCTGVYTVIQADVDSGSVLNVVSATGTLPDGGTPTSPGASHEVLADATGELTTAKVGELVDSDTDGLADVGETIDYTITATNTGSVTVLDVEVNDPKIASLTCTPVAGADLAPGEVMTCTASYTVTQADVDSSSVDNTATATGVNPADPDGDPVAGGGGSSVPADPAAALTTVKTGELDDTDEDNLADVGEIVDYTITVTNTGAVTVSNIQVDDPLIATLNCNPALGGSLAASESLTCTGSYTVTQADVDAGLVVNSVTVTGATPGGGTPTTPGGQHEIPTDGSGELTTVKTGALTDEDDDELADAGETIDYTITVTNTGSVTVSNIQVNDPKIATLDCMPSLGGSLAANESLTCTGTYTVTQADVDSGSVINTVTATGATPGGGTPTSPGDTNEVSTDETGTLTTAKTAKLTDGDADGVADVGETIDYTITVTNTGAVTVLGVEVDDPMLASMTCSGTDVDLAPGAELVCTGSYTVTQDDVDAGTVTNVATATGDNPTDPSTPIDGGGQTTTPTDSSSELTTTKVSKLDDSDSDGLADVGETIDYTITVTNTAEVTISDVEVDDPKLDTLTCTPALGADLAAGEAMTCTGTYEVTQADVDNGSVYNEVAVTGTTPDGGTPTSPGGSNNVPTDSTGVLTIGKSGELDDSDGDGLADVGETIDYTISVTNTGSITVNDVEVEDPKIAELACTPVAGADLAPGEAMTCTATYTVTQADVDTGSVDNTATATGSNPSDPDGDPVSGGGGSSIPADTSGALTTVKTGELNDDDGDGLADAGETVDYTITVTNTGSVTVSDIQVTDPLIPALDCTPSLGGSLAANESLTCTGTYTVTQADVDSGAVINSVTVSGSTGDCSATARSLDCDTPDSPGGSHELPTDEEGALAVVKEGELADSDADGLADLGEMINYTITVENVGAPTATEVVVEDPMLTNAGSPLVCAVDGASVTNGEFALAAGEQVICLGAHQVTQADIDAGVVLNVATASSTNVIDPGGPRDTSTGTSVNEVDPGEPVPGDPDNPPTGGPTDPPAAPGGPGDDGDTPDNDDDTLPNTGGNILPPLGIGLIAAVFGGLCLIRTRRRQATTVRS